MLRNIHNTLKNKMHSKGKDNRFLSPDGYQGSPRKGMRRIRQRSNSDITISELDGDGSEGWSFSGWTPMHREYGSTSSIDKHGGSGESFFDMLKGYQSSEAPDQRSPAPERLGELLTVAPVKQAALDLPDGPLGQTRGSPASRLKEREKHLKRRSKSETGGESIFRKLRSVRGESDSPKGGSDAEDGRSEEAGPPLKPWASQKGFSHYDVQSMLFDLNDVIQLRQTASKRKNTTTGASAAAAASATSTLSSTHSLPYSSPGGSQEELNARDSPGPAGEGRGLNTSPGSGSSPPRPSPSPPALSAKKQSSWALTGEDRLSLLRSEWVRGEADAVASAAAGASRDRDDASCPLRASSSSSSSSGSTLSCSYSLHSVR
jgi:signal-induced proliferation-associated 1 like protein 1